MKKGLRILTITALALVSTVEAAAQRAATVGRGEQPAAQTRPSDDAGRVVAPKPAPAPATVKAKYEGGIIGFGKADGTLSFDDMNKRLLFRDKTGRELFSVPYQVIMAAHLDTQARRPTAATVAAMSVPYGLGLPALFIKKKHRYLTLNYRDADTNAEGIASFKMDNKELLASVLNTLAEKAGLTQRGEAYVRQRQPTSVREVPDRP